MLIILPFTPSNFKELASVIKEINTQLKDTVSDPYPGKIPILVNLGLLETASSPLAVTPAVSAL